MRNLRVKLLFNEQKECPPVSERVSDQRRRESACTGIPDSRQAQAFSSHRWKRLWLEL